MSSEWFSEADLRGRTAAIDDRLLDGLVAAGLPVPLAIAFGIAYESITGTSAVGTVGVNLSYGVASILVVAGVYALVSERERRAIFRFERPSATELSWTAICFPLGTGAFLAASAATEALGLELGGFDYTLGDPVVVAAVIFGGVLVAPIAEEILFRGLVLGSLLGRGLSPLVAGAASIVAFGFLHVAILGLAGVITTAAWAVFPTLLRLRFDNLTGAWLLHLVNNLWAYIGVVALGLA